MDQGQKIATLRKEKGMTQAELGTKLNVTFQAVSKWERGESYPDFATLSRLSKLFDVPIVYFEDNGEEIVKQSAITAQPTLETNVDTNAETNSEKSQIVGFCKECGKIVYTDDVGKTTPYILCKECDAAITARREQEAIRLQKEREEQERQTEEQERIYTELLRRKRNKGLILAGVICAVIAILAVVGMLNNPSNVLATIGGLIVGLVFVYAFLAQFFWKGLVRRIASIGGHVIGTPGVIFTLDLDGLVFLIAVKVLFAVLRFIIYIVGTLFFILIALVISPFTFVPQLLKLNRGEDVTSEDDDFDD